ncbi:hypothetical protein GCM10023317_96530 [Actinopolymorpha pittospori]
MTLGRKGRNEFRDALLCHLCPGVLPVGVLDTAHCAGRPGRHRVAVYGGAAERGPEQASREPALAVAERDFWYVDEAGDERSLTGGGEPLRVQPRLSEQLYAVRRPTQVSMARFRAYRTTALEVPSLRGDHRDPSG